MTGVRLVWDGKDAEIPRLRLPLQVVETVNSPRADRGTIFEGGGSQDDDGWRNRLVWGDNLHALASLTEELAGQVDLVYIDPPFDSRQDYKVRIAVGDGAASADQELAKIASVIEEKAYRDTWGNGVDSYLTMLYQRLVLLRELMSDRGSLVLHIGRNMSGYIRPVLDEIFGVDNFINELTWKRSHAHGDVGQGARHFGRVSEAIFLYRKTEKAIWHAQYLPYTDERLARDYKYVDETGRRYRLTPVDGPGGAAKGNPHYEFLGVEGYWRYSKERMQRLYDGDEIVLSSTGKSLSRKKYLDEASGTPITDLWDDVGRISPTSSERLGYDTQKPEALLERIIKSSSDEGSIVLDCFAGSGTTPAVAERLGRRWVAVDIGRFAVHTTRKRLLDLPGCKPFVVANLGRYERQVWQRATTGSAVAAYLDFVVTLYGATPVEGFQHLHGTAGPRAVHVGAVDAPVSLAEIKDALDEASGAGHPGLDVLGWEFEMGLHELVQDVAKGAGVDLRLRRIPREVMDPRAVASGEVTFHELAYLKVEAKATKRSVRVTLTDFVLANPELVPVLVRDKISGWADYVDYWACDFTFGSGGGAQADDTSDTSDTFRNQWQSYRTRADRSLELTAIHDYDKPGTHTVLVKVVDIFGNDTTTAVDVSVR